MNGTRLYTGRDALEAAEALRQETANKERWPYPHVYPPPSSTPVNVITTTPVAVPAAAAQVEVLEYTVPSGKRFIMQGIIQQIFAGAFTPGDGIWTVDQNSPLGVTNVQASPVPYLARVVTPLGSFTIEPFLLLRAYEFEPLTQLRSKFTNVSAGAGVLLSGFFGYLIPAVGSPRK